MNLISILGMVWAMLFVVIYSYRVALRFELRMTVRDVLLPKEIEGKSFYIKSILWLGCSVLFINISGLEGSIVYVGIVLNVVVATLIFHLSIFLGIMLRVFVMMLRVIIEDSLKKLATGLGLLSDLFRKLNK